MQESYTLAFIKILPDYIDLNHKIIENRKIFKNPKILKSSILIIIKVLRSSDY